VGTDGLTHEIAVKKPLGYGLDEKALEAVQQWRFDPATEDGKAVSKRITVEVSFRL
jgi:TonB family protein